MTAHLAVCGVGAVLAMAGHFPSRPRFWVPHTLGLAAMLLAWLPGTAPAGVPVALFTLGAVLVWQVRSLPSVRDRWAGCSDTVAMAVLIALAPAAPSGVATSDGTAGMHHGAGLAGSGDDGATSIALAVLACWLLVRVCVGLTADDGAARPRLGVVRSCGGLVMLAGMTTMVA
jgi:hypothetical protein